MYKYIKAFSKKYFPGLELKDIDTIEKTGNYRSIAQCWAIVAFVMYVISLFSPSLKTAINSMISGEIINTLFSMAFTFAVLFILTGKPPLREHAQRVLSSINDLIILAIFILFYELIHKYFKCNLDLSKIPALIGVLYISLSMHVANKIFNSPAINKIVAMPLKSRLIVATMMVIAVAFSFL
jgi:hypothetical protein